MNEWACYEASAGLYASVGEDDPAWREHYRRRLAEMLPKRPAAVTIADVGCGVGYDLAAFAAMGLNTVGIDGSAAMLQLAAGRSPASMLLNQDLRRPWQPCVDGIWSMFALLHLPECDLPACLRAWRESLADDGALMLGSAQSDLVATRRVEGWLDQPLPCVFYYHTCEIVQQLLRTSGFHVCDAEYNTPARYRGGVYDEFKLKAYVITARAE